MSLTRWDPFRELEDISDRLNRVFARPKPSPLGSAGRELLALPDWSPAVDIAETADEYLLKAELPEVKKEDVKVTVENGVLCIEGERKQEVEEKDRKFRRVERFYGSFLRTFTVPDGVDGAQVKAEFKDGVLNVHLPKTEKAKSRTLLVNVT